MSLAEGNAGTNNRKRHLTGDAVINGYKYSPISVTVHVHDLFYSSKCVLS